MAVRSRRFSTTTVAGTAPVVLLAVGPDRTAIARIVHGTNALATSRTLQFYVNGNEAYRLVVPGSGAAAVVGGFILNPGDVLSCSWDIAVGIGNVGVYGSLLAGAPV